MGHGILIVSHLRTSSLRVFHNLIRHVYMIEERLLIALMKHGETTMLPVMVQYTHVFIVFILTIQALLFFFDLISILWRSSRFNKH